MKAHAIDAYAQIYKEFLKWNENGKGVCRTCGYCGSMHPDDLITAMSAPNADIELADMKYGWPHKWYINSPAIMAPGAKKFYTVHLQDASEEARSALEKAMGLRFEFEGTGVRWSPLK